MARAHPDGWRELKPTGAAARRVETLARLVEALPDSLTIYHGVHWTLRQEDRALPGEIDFAVVDPAGRILLIEQVTGLLEETPEGLVKRHGGRDKRVTVHLARAAEGLRARLRQALPDTTPDIDVLLYCPDYRVRVPASAGLDPSRILDAGQRERLAARIAELLPDAAPAPVAARVHRFLRDELELVPDVDAAIGQSHALYTRLAGGLAHWARRIDCQPFRLRITGTAGSGKTQLALAVLEDAARAGRRALYVCYNRPLADHIARLAPAEATVATYHQLADRLMRAAGQMPDFTQPGAFKTLEIFMASHQPAPDTRYDELIVDEGQDFQADWRDALLRLLHPEGRAWWLEDPMQNLYGRPPVELPGWVGLRAETNYRTPRDLLAWLAPLLPGQALEPGSPVTDTGVEWLIYDSPDSLIERTKTAITKGLGAGFRKERMALITYRGREHSAFTGLDRLGPHSLRAFENRYDLFGNPVYREGDLLIDSVHRFKGRSAPCVIFTEIDFEQLDDAARRKLFVGITRATLKLVLVVSERAAKWLPLRP